MRIYICICARPDVPMYLRTTTQDARYLQIEFCKAMLEIENSLNIVRFLRSVSRDRFL